MTERFGYDVPKLTRDEATELCVYHLRTAAALFQLVPDDGNATLIDEIVRQTKDDLESVDRSPMFCWAASILEAYEAMKAQD